MNYIINDRTSKHEPYLSVQEYAEAMNLSTTTVRRYIKDGIITARQSAPNSHWRILYKPNSESNNEINNLLTKP